MRVAPPQLEQLVLDGGTLAQTSAKHGIDESGRPAKAERFAISTVSFTAA
jgi:hypothetical protein